MRKNSFIEGNIMKNIKVLVLVLTVTIILGKITLANVEGALVAHYPFNGNANDESIYGNNGIVYGATLTTDRFNNINSAYYFDGIDDYIDIPYHLSQQPNTLTISVWINKAYESSKYSTIIASNGGGDGSVDDPYVVGDSGFISVSFEGLSSLQRIELYSNNILSHNQWHHIVTIFNDEVDSAYLYINGILNDVKFEQNMSLDQNNLGLKIGTYQMGNGSPLLINCFNGKIDDIMIFNRPLNKSEIDSLYHDNGWAIFETGLIAYYPLDNDANDYSGNSYHGTINGNPEFVKGVVNNALKLTGMGHTGSDGDHVILPMLDFSAMEELTISIWVNEEGFSTTAGEAYIRYGLTPSGWLGIERSTPYDSDGEYIRFASYSNDPPLNIDFSFSDRNQFIHYCLVNKDDTLYAYRNANLIGSIFQNIYVSGSTAAIGRHWWNDGSLTSTRLNGTIDDVRIYNRALTSNEITSLYNMQEFETSEHIELEIMSLNAPIGSILSLPVYISFPSDTYYDSAELRFSFDNTSLNYIRMDTTNTLTGSAHWNYAYNMEDDSILVIWMAGANEMSGNGILFNLEFNLIGNPCEFYPINIKDAVFNTGTEQVSITSGGVYINPIPSFGDVDGNGIIQAHDAALILKHIVGIDTLLCQGLANADVTLDKTVSALDAAVILQYGVGLLSSLPYDTTSNGNLKATGVFSMEDEIITSGELIELPLYIENAHNIYSFEGCLEYDPEFLIFSDIQLSSDRSDYQIHINNHNGHLSWAGAGINPEGNDGIFLLIKFSQYFTGINSNTIISLISTRINEELIQTDVCETIVHNVVGTSEKTGIPTEFQLAQNYPNPFNPTTFIEYGLPEQSDVKLMIYDIKGNTVKQWTYNNQNAGYYSVIWNGTNNSGNQVSTGIYFYRIIAGDFIQTKKMMFMK